MIDLWELFSTSLRGPATRYMTRETFSLGEINDLWLLSRELMDDFD